MFFRRHRHKLPRFPHTVIPTFRSLCEVVSEEDVEKLVPQVDTCLQDFEQLSKENPHINIDLARQIAERCRYLMERYPQFDPKEKALIMGAVRYFAIADDPISETSFASGFDDDARVINHVLEILGLEDMVITVR